MTILSTIVSSDKAGNNNAIGKVGMGHIDRFQNGNLFAMVSTNIPLGGTGGMRFMYSTDNGATWNVPPNPSPDFTPVNTSSNASMFIDQDDFVHVMHQDVLDSFKMKYRRGTPNAGRTGVTWSTPLDITGGLVGGNLGDPAVTAHREGTGWVCHVAATYVVASTEQVVWKRIQITSGGVMTQAPAGWDSVTSLTTITTAFPWLINIDFLHTGDGKSHAGVPSIFFSWMEHQSGAGHALRFRKATWTSANTWSLGTLRDIDTTINSNTDTDYTAMWCWHSGFFDGTRYVMVGMGDSGAAGSKKFFIIDRDAADTTTTNTYTSTFAGTDQLQRGTATYDLDKNVRIWANGSSPAFIANMFYSQVYNRPTSTMSIVAPGVINNGNNRWVTSRKGWGAAGQVDYMTEIPLTPVAGSGQPVQFGAFDINVAPNAPTPTYPIGSVIIGRNIAQDFTWSFSDPDGTAESESAHDIRYRVAGSGTWTTITNTVSTVSKHTFAANTFSNATNYEWQVASYDQNGAVGPFSATQFFTANTAPTVSAWVNPTNGGTIATSSITAQWTDSGHTSYQLIMTDNAGQVFLDTAEVVSSASTRAISSGLAPNGVTRNFSVRVKNNGIWSPYFSALATVSYTPAANPTITGAYVDALGIGVPHAVNFTFSHPTPSGGQPTVTSMDLWVRDVGDTGPGIQLTSGQTPTAAQTWYAPKARKAQEARVFMYTSNTSNTYSTWQAIPGQIALTGFLVHDPLAPTTTLLWCKQNDSGAKDSYQAEYQSMQYQGREYPTAEFGDAVTRTIEVSKVYADTGESDALRTLVTRRTALCYRDSKGRKVFGVANGHNEDDTGWGKMTGLSLQQIEWAESL